MKKLLPLALILALLPLTYAPAQEAPAKPALLTADEIALWQAWIRGDIGGCYSQAQKMLEAPGYEGDEFRIALALQARCADELGWHDAHARDLKALMKVHDGTYQADLLRWELIERLKHQGKLDEVPAHSKALGFITDWWVAGPFPNDRGQGFEDVQEPETKLALDAEYVGKDGQPVKWRKLPAKPLDGTIDLGAIMRPNKEATAFLMTAIWCEEDDPKARFGIGSDNETQIRRITSAEPNEAGAFEFDAVAGTKAERDIGFDQDTSTIFRGKALFGGLYAGWNAIVVKSGQSEGNWRVRIRLQTSTQYRFAASSEDLVSAVRNITTTPSDAGGVGGRQLVSRVRLLNAMSELLIPTLDRTSRLPASWLEDVELDNVGKPRNLLDSEKAIVAYVRAWANRSSAAVAAGKEENRRRELLKQCLELDPKAARAALELSQYYTTTFGNPELADQYAQAAVKAAPGWTNARLYAARVVQMKGLETEVERQLATLLQEQPQDANVLRFAAYYAGLRKDYALSNELFAKALKADFTDSYARDRLIERAVQRGDVVEANRHAADARKLNPFDTESGKWLADLHSSKGDYAAAEREVQAALAIAPRDDTLLELLGRVYAGWSDSDQKQAKALREKSLEAYRAALDANPNREDIERYLEFIEGEQPPFEALLQLNIEDRIKAALETPVDSDNPYETVFDEQITVVNEDGTTATYSQVAHRVTNDRGRDWLRSIRAPAWADQQARCTLAEIWRADGEHEQGRRSRWAASFPPLEVGDIVHARFRVTDREQSFFGDFYGTIEVLGDDVPIREKRLVWVLPRGKQFHEYRTLNAPERTESEVHGRKVWTYSAENLPRLEDESLAPPAHQRAPTIQLSTYRDWKEFGRWYYNLIRKQLEPTPEMTAKVGELIAGLTTEKDKAQAIYDWVVTAVRYNADWHFGIHGYKPFSAGAVFGRQIGDCKDKAILMCAMLGIAGVKAYPVIINAEYYRGDEDITLPMPHHFNHAIACIEYGDGSRQFVDGTTTYHAFDELPGSDAGAEVIIVRPDGGERAKIPVAPAPQNSVNKMMEAEFVAGGAIKLRVTTTAIGDYAAAMRSEFQREGDRKRQLEEQWAGHFAGATVSDVGVENITGLRGAPKLTYTVELPGAWSEKDGAREFKAALEPIKFGQTPYASLTERKANMLLPTPYSGSATLKVKLPAGLSPETVQGMSIKHANAELSVDYEMSEDGSTLTITRRYALLGGVVKPEDYPELRAKFAEFDNAEARTVRLVKE